MTPSEARIRLLAQHERLRELLARAKVLALRFVAGDPVARDLDAGVIELRDAFAEHNQFELGLLEPMLREADAWGPARVARMLEEHAAEHAVLTEFLAGRISDVVPRLHDFAEEIEAHMAAEERTFLSEAVLSNDLDLIAVRNRLRARRRELLARYQHTRELAEEELDSREIEPMENATELWDARLLSAMGDANTRSLASVLDALRRLAEGRYGRCVVCSTDVDRERLAALPETDRCLGCALRS